MKRILVITFFTMIFIACQIPLILGPTAASALGLAQALAQNANQSWVTAWGTSQQALGELKITNATVRMIARVTIPGDSIRIRLDNTFGTAPVTFGRTTAGPRIQGPAVAEGLNKAVTFSGKNSVTIPAGGSVESDAVALRVDARQDLAVSCSSAEPTWRPASMPEPWSLPISPATAPATRRCPKTASLSLGRLPRCSG